MTDQERTDGPLSPEADGDARDPAPRAAPRSGRRLVLRVALLLAFSAGSIFVLAVALSLLADRLDSGTLARLVSGELERRLDRPVAASSFDIALLDGLFEIRNLQIGREPGSAGPTAPAFAIERIAGRLGWRALLPTGLHLDDLEVSGVRAWGQDDGGVPPPEDAPGFGPLTNLLTSRISLSSETMAFAGATIGYRNRPTPWEVRLDDVEVDFEAAEGGLDGRIRSGTGAIRMWDRPDLSMAIQADLRLRGGELHLDRVELSGELLSMEGSGVLDLENDLAGPLELTGGGRAGGVGRLMFDFDGLDTSGEPPFSFVGGAEFIEDGLAIAGDFVLPSGRFYGVPVEDWSGFLYIGPDRAEISAAEGIAAGGAATFRLVQPQPRDAHRAEIAVTATDAALGPAAAGYFGVPTTLASRVDLDADLEMVLGTLEETLGTLRATGRAPDPGGTGLGFGFSLDLEMDERETRVADLVVRGAAFRAEGQGAFRDGEADLVVSGLAGESAEADALQQEIRRVLFGEDPSEIAWEVAGAAGFDGTVGGQWPDHLVLEGEVEGRSLSVGPLRTDTLVATGGVGPEDMWLDSVSARRGESTLQTSGVFAHADGEEYPDMEFDARWNEWDAREIIEYLEWDLEADGVVTGWAQTTRKDEWVTGGGFVEGWSGHVLEQPFDEARIEWRLLGDRARLAPMAGSFGGGVASGALDIGLVEWEMDGRITGTDFPLTPGLAPEWITIRSDFDLTVGGDLLVPELHLAARVPNALVLGLPLGPGEITGAVFGEDFEGVGELDSGRASARMSGKVPLGADGSGTILVSGVEVAPLVFEEAAARGIRLVVSGSGDFHIEDPLDEWMEGTAELTGLELDLPGVATGVRLTGPAAIRVEDARVHVEGLGLTDGVSGLVLGGSVGLDDLILDVDVSGETSLAAAGSLVDGLQADGTLEVDAEVVGSALSPEVLGRGALRGASFRLDGFSHALTEVEGVVNFDRRTAQIAEVSGRLAGGTALVAGAVSLEEASATAVDLRLQLDDARLRYPADLAATVNADLHLLGDQEGQLLTGAVRLDEAVWSREYELFASILSDLDAVAAPPDPATGGFLDGLRMDVQVETDSPFAVRNSVFQLDAAADFALRGTPTAPALLGRADLVGGELYFGAHRFAIVSGRADFIDPEGIEPVFDVEAETTVRSYRVRLTASGSAAQVNANLSSDPPLREADILRLLSGAPEEELLTQAQDDDVAAASAASVLSQQLSNMIGRRAGRVFGIDRLTIDPFLIGRFSNPTARVTLAKQLSRDLNVRYSSSVTAAEDSIIVVEYTPRGPVSWIFSRDQDGSLGVDVRFHRSF